MGKSALITIGRKSGARFKKVFEEQLGLACDLGLPVVVHDREAHQDTFELLKNIVRKAFSTAFPAVWKWPVRL